MKLIACSHYGHVGNRFVVSRRFDGERSWDGRRNPAHRGDMGGGRPGRRLQGPWYARRQERGGASAGGVGAKCGAAVIELDMAARMTLED
jgi:hypothetical protein